MTKKKTTIPPEVIRAFEDCQSMFPAGHVKKWGKKNGLEYYQFVIPDGKDGPLVTGFPLVCSWDGQKVEDVYGMDALRVLRQFA